MLYSPISVADLEERKPQFIIPPGTLIGNSCMDFDRIPTPAFQANGVNIMNEYADEFCWRVPRNFIGLFILIVGNVILEYDDVGG